MSEWTTYRLSDLLLFSPRVFYRLFEQANATAWPAQVLTVGTGVALIAILLAPTVTRLRLGAMLLAVVWAWVAWFFIANHYATINWAAVWFAALFYAEAGLLVIAAALPPQVKNTGPTILRPRIAIIFCILAVIAYPLLALLAGRPFIQAEVFGIAPDPTAIMTLVCLAAVPLRLRPLLMIAPGLWCVVSGLTLWVLEDPLFWLPPAATALALSLTMTGREPAR
jgi:hypothetical protein